MRFDTHAHYDDERFDADRTEILQKLPENDVKLVINPGCDGESSKRCVELAHAFDHVYAAVGWHPEEWESWNGESLPLLRALAGERKVCAIGEIGLDYYWDREHRSEMRAIFETQLQLARELGMPVIVHDRDAHADCLDIVSCFPGVRGVFHCFSGSAEMAEILLRDGWYLGFDGPVTYKNNRRAAEVLAVTPPERILLETDSPYMPPVPFRGERNDSTKLPFIAAKVAELKGMEAAELEQLTYENGRRLFGI